MTDNTPLAEDAVEDHTWTVLRNQSRVYAYGTIKPWSVIIMASGTPIFTA
jgi:hypothetical protein